jgi:hypothetical protein
MKRFLTPPPQPPPSPVRLVGPKHRGDWNLGMYANAEAEAAKLMEQGYEPVALAFKDDYPVILMVQSRSQP